MIKNEMPYFLTNEEWYEEDITFSSSDGRGYHLTDKAPQEAIESYNEFYKEEEVEIEGRTFIVGA